MRCASAADFVVLCEIASTVRLASPWLLSADAFDRGCTYRELVCECATIVGRFYVATTTIHDAFRELYLLAASATKTLVVDQSVVPLGQRVSCLPADRELHSLALQTVLRSTAAMRDGLRVTQRDLAVAAATTTDDDDDDDDDNGNGRQSKSAAAAGAPSVPLDDAATFAVANVLLLPPNYAPAAGKSRKRSANGAVVVSSSDAATEPPKAANKRSASGSGSGKCRFGDATLVCPKNKCRRSFPSWDAFVEHCIHDHSCKPAVCPVSWCSRIWASSGMMSGHVGQHQIELRCPVAGCVSQVFANWRVYREHCRQCHAITSKDRDCPEKCGFKAPDHTALEVHVMQKHPMSASAVGMGVY
jgi:hypothetical protein